jgi:hypothetical protein
MTDIPHDPVQRPQEQDLVLVIHGDDDHQFRLPFVVGLTKGEILRDEVVRARGDCRVAAKK